MPLHDLTMDLESDRDSLQIGIGQAKDKG